jgi:hypothetical protein
MQPLIVSGPSIHGLDAPSQEPDSVAYLLEDEPRSHRSGFLMLFLAIVLFLAGAAFVIYQKHYFVAPYAGNAPVVNAPAFAYERTPESVWEQTKIASPTVEPVLPNRSLSDHLALENISDTMRNAKAREKLAAVAKSAPNNGARLLAEGEKYLYGRGVTANCKLAVKNFENAADAGNARAMAHLGSMYGSGHCVKFNRITAYGWFAKAKNADPGNAWLDSSMNILWRNMSINERAAILK